jgi:hypothetical protein
MWIPKLPMLGLLQLWAFITLCVDLRLRWGLNQSCSPHQKISNDMLHTTYTQKNLIDSRLLMVRSEIANLTPDPSFGHNLCFRCPNESCEHILNIYISISFPWYKEFLKAMGFDPCNHTLKIWESIETPTPKLGVPSGMWGGLFPHILLHS